MKNLSAVGKKWFISISIAVVLIGLIYWSATSFYNYQVRKSVKEKEALIEMYQHRIDSINDVNTKLIYEIRILDREIDSLQNNKQIIYKEYDKKVNVIYDASSADHARWLESVLLELRDTNK